MIDRFEYSPWDFWAEADETAHRVQLELQAQLVAERPNHDFGERCFVSELASLDNERLQLGDRSYIAAGVYTTGAIEVGRDCGLNPYTVVRGQVRLGDGVRIGAHTSILGFNHTMNDPDLEMFRQPLESRGIIVGDDVWVGSHVVILDGVNVGDHSVIAAGAIVTKDVPAGAIVGGNPARILRWRIPPVAGQEALRPSRDLAGRVAALAETAHAQASDILRRSWDPQTGLFADRAGIAPTVRAQCDAIELADLLLGGPPPQISRDLQVQRLMDWQSPETGAVAPLRTDGSPERDADPSDPDVAYHVLCVGYALDLLGERLPHPVHLPALASAAATTEFLDKLPWTDRAWHAGHWVDMLGTALQWNRLRGDPTPDGVREALIGWLVTRNDPETGMWGRPGPDHGLLQLVNGSYRTTRGTFSQWGIPLPRPERVIDTVLRHVRDERYFRADRQDACNVLDAAHPLWLTQATGYRSADVESTARRLLEQALDSWTDGAGFGFRAPAAGPSVPGTAPSLQGTEMWLATIWYLADVVGVSDALGYRPRGIHRPEPVSATVGL